VAREPGERAKIAVTSRDSAVDPVGACVGMKGSRVQAVVQELKGEKIDIVPWDRDIARYVCNAIQPAEVSRVLIDEDRKIIELIVPDDQLSLAIGRRGQNVRLASKLLGWKIEITSETKVEQMKKEILWYLVDQHGIDEDVVDYMFKLGYHSPENILGAEVEELASLPGIDEDLAERIQQLAFELKRKKDKGKLELPPELLDNRDELTVEDVFGRPAPKTAEAGGEVEGEAASAEDAQQAPEAAPASAEAGADAAAEAAAETPASAAQASAAGERTAMSADETAGG